MVGCYLCFWVQHRIPQRRHAQSWHVAACVPPVEPKARQANAVRIYVTTVPFVGHAPITRGPLGCSQAYLTRLPAEEACKLQPLVITPGKRHDPRGGRLSWAIGEASLIQGS